MLSKTEEFKDFATLAIDSGNPVAPATKTVIKEGDQEKEDWIPEDAYKIAHDFRNKCASNISKPMMN